MLPVSIPKIKCTRETDTDNKSEFMARIIPPGPTTTKKKCTLVWSIGKITLAIAGL